jgi:hypothetical protein
MHHDSHTAKEKDGHYSNLHPDVHVETGEDPERDSQDHHIGEDGNSSRRSIEDALADALSVWVGCSIPEKVHWLALEDHGADDADHEAKVDHVDDMYQISKALSVST